MRRVRNHHSPQGQLFPTWRYHAYLSGRPTLRLPAGWPWAEPLTAVLDILRALPPVPG